MRYASALFDHADIRGNYKFAYTFPNAPEETQGGLILPAENKICKSASISRTDWAD
jgi:hypothetical protein